MGRVFVFGLDRRFAAVLGTAGSVCGVSASAAVAASIGARKDEIAAFLPAGVGGAWIISLEFAD